MLVAGGAVWSLTRPAPLRTTRVAIPTGPLALTASLTDLAVSRDGSHIVYRARSDDDLGQLVVRALDQQEATPLGVTGTQPFFSPENDWVGFSGGGLQKVSVTGGPPIRICDCGGGGAASWAPDDTIVFSDGGRLWRVSAEGGEPEQLTNAADEDSLAHMHPEVFRVS
jgi:hypothetical protein